MRAGEVLWVPTGIALGEGAIEMRPPTLQELAGEMAQQGRFLLEQPGDTHLNRIRRALRLSDAATPEDIAAEVEARLAGS